jgi:predicted DNA-binding transcriptional regulator YafY
MRAFRARKPVSRFPSTRPPLRRIVWTMGQLKNGRPLKATDIAGEFEIDVRTAYRDICFLRDQCRAPLEFDRQRGSYVLTEPTFSLPLVTMTRGELVSLFFAEMAARQYRGTPYEKDLEAALGKIGEYLPDGVTIDPNPLAGFLSLDLGPLTIPDPTIFRDVVESLCRRHRIDIRYSSLSRGRTTDRVVEPYHVYNLAGIWYLAAFDHHRAEVRDFALHRISRVTPIDERFEIDPSFDFKRYMGGSLFIEKGRKPVSVAIRFGPRQARWIRERRWHSTAKIQDRIDGGCVLRMKVAGTDEVKRWVMQYGAEAEVLSPAALRREIAVGLKEAARLYGNERKK